MATIYLRSTDGNDADDGSTWALAKATLQAAMTAAGAGGTVYMSQAHAETAAVAVTNTSPGTAASPQYIICVSDAAEPPTTRATTGSLNTTTANDAISLNGFFYMYGVQILPANSSGSDIFIAGTDASHYQIYESCTLQARNTSLVSIGTDADDSLNFNVGGQLINCAFVFNNVGSGIEIRGGNWTIKGGSIAASGTVPTTLFVGGISTFNPVLRLEGVDLSTFGSGKTLFNVADVASIMATLVDCKLGGSVTLTSGTPVGQSDDAAVTVINSDSADTNTRFSRMNYQATETSETTIVRTSGASDGTTTFSRKVVTTANSKTLFPYRSLPIEFWNETTGSAITATIATITDNVTLTDADAWLEGEYLGTSGFPLALFASDRVSDPILGTPANQTTDGGSTWTTTGLGTPVKQSLAVTFTPAEKGIVRVYVCIAKASTTVYYDPKVQVS